MVGEIVVMAERLLGKTAMMAEGRCHGKDCCDGVKKSSSHKCIVMLEKSLRGQILQDVVGLVVY